MDKTIIDKKHLGWSVRPPSKEYKSLSDDIQEKIKDLLDENPIRIGEVAKRLGIRVVRSTLAHGISGYIGQRDGQFLIKINRHESMNRQRFTLAHEIAHFLLHKDRIIDAGGWSENVLLRSGQPEQIEYEANRLASDLIMPSHVVEQIASEYIGTTTDDIVERLANDFSVSVAAMEIKLNIK